MFTYKKDLTDPDIQRGCYHALRAKHPGMQFELALGSITDYKASGGDGIPVELFQNLKMML